MAHEKFPSFNWFPRDWIAGTATLTLEQQGAFARLLSYAWEQTPPCTLPDSDRALASLLGIPVGRWRKIEAEVRSKFEACGDGRIRNPKLFAVYTEMVAHRAKRSRAGQLGNEARWTSQTDRNAIANGIANGIAKASPPSPSPSPIPLQQTEKENPPIGGQKKDEPKLVATKRRGVSLPEGWEPNRKHNQIAADCRVDCVVEAEHFRDWALAKGQVFRDWDAGFRNWLRNAKKFNGNRPPAGSEASKYQNEYPGRGRNGSSSLNPVSDVIAIGTMSPNGERRWSGSRWEHV